jgi:hypothetical protein
MKALPAVFPTVWLRTLIGMFMRNDSTLRAWASW